MEQEGSPTEVASADPDVDNLMALPSAFNYFLETTSQQKECSLKSLNAFNACIDDWLHLHVYFCSVSGCRPNSRAYAMAKHRKRLKRKRTSSPITSNSSCSSGRSSSSSSSSSSTALMRLLENLKSGSPRLPLFQLFDFTTKPESSLRSLSLWFSFSAISCS